MNISVIRDPQTGVTKILLDDEALDVLDSILTDFEEEDSHLLIRSGEDAMSAVDVLRQDVARAFSESRDDDE